MSSTINSKDRFIQFEAELSTTNPTTTPAIDNIEVYKRGSIGYIDLRRKPQKPQLFLARPNRTIVAKLTEAHGVSLEAKLGSLNKLEFLLPFELEDDHQLVRNAHIDTLREKYLIKVVHGIAEEWYVITGIEDSGDDNGDSKHVIAMSLANELQSKLYRTFTTEGEFGVGPQNLTQLATVALTSTLWSIDYVDAKFDTMHRSFSVSSKNALEFIFQIAETFKAVCVWNTVDRKVSFYDQENVGANRGLMISYGKYLKTLRKNVTTDEMVTRLKVFGKDDLSIQRVNPSGSNYLEDFSFFLFPFQRDSAKNVLASSYYMTDNLCNALMDFQQLVETKRGEFTGLLAQKDVKRKDETIARSTLDDLKLALQLTEDIVDVQKNQNLYSYKEFTYGGSGANDTFALKGGYKYAIMAFVSDMTNVVLRLDAFEQTVPSGKWTVLAKKDFTATDATTHKYKDGSVKLDMSGSTAGATVKYVIAKITDGEFIGGCAEGVTINSDGGALSVLMSNDMELDIRSVKIGDTVYVENGKQVGFQFDGANTDFAGYVTYIDSKKGTITLDRQFPAGDYMGWLVTTNANETVLIDRYVVEAQQAKVDAQQKALDAILVSITNLDSQINDLRKSIDVTANFTPDQIKELNPFIIEKEWSDSNYINDQDLYDDAVKRFELIKQPQTVIEIDIVNFLEVLESQNDWDKLNLGDTVTIKYETFDVNVRAKIIDITYSFESGDIKLTIANVKEIESDKDKLVKMLYRSVSTSNAVDMNQFKWDTTAGSISEINSIIQGQWDAAKRGITAGTKQSVTIDDRGITITDPTEPLAYLRATHGVFGITNDGGKTYKQAITKDGIVAERLYGQIIMGENLIVGDKDGILKLLGNKGIVFDRAGIEVMKFGLYDTLADGTEKFGLQLKTTTHKVIMDRNDGFKIQKFDGTLWNDIAWLDTTGKLNLKDIVASGTIEATSIIATTQLKVGNINVADLIANGLQTQQNWIKADQIEANAITAKHTITGATIQTATTGARVVINSTGLSAYNATTEIFSIKNGSINMTSGNITWGAGKVNPPSVIDVGAEGAIIKQGTAPSLPVGGLWLDTSVVPNVLKRWDGATWQKATPTTAAEVGARSDTWIPTAAQVGAEIYVPRSGTAPTAPAVDQLWFDTSNANMTVLRRWDGAKWVKSIPTTASEVSAVTNTQTAVFDTLTDNGARKGLYMSAGELYMSADFIKTGTLLVSNQIAIQTAATGARLTFDSTGIKAYNSAGTNTVSIGSDGNASFTGNISGASNINVSSDVYVGNALVLNQTNFSGGILWGTGSSKQAEIYIDPAGGLLEISNHANGRINLKTTPGNGIYANGLRIDVAPIAVFG